MRMGNHMGRFVPAAIAAAGLLFMAACGGSSTSTTTVPPTPTPGAAGPVTIYPGTVNVPVGGQAQFTAFLASAPTATFTWTVSSGGGTIDSSTGLYTAPASIPSPASITITATGSSATGTAVVTVVAAPAGGLAVSPAAIVVPAGGTFQFSATSNGNPVTPTWQVSGTTLGDSIHGFIGANGAYTAPLSPPPGGSTTVTALSGGSSATATVVVVFSNTSLNGQYAFSYSGQDSKGPLMVAGSFAANPSAGTITGIEDYNSTSQAPAGPSAVTGTYSVNPDGSATATLTDAAAGGSETWNLVLVASTQGQTAPRALLTRFDTTATGSGEADVQNTTQFTLGSFNGNYAFSLSGADGSGKPLQIAGLLDATNQTIPVNFVKDDINDAGTNTEVTPDTSLHGLFSSSANLASNGRGTLQLIYGSAAEVPALDNVTLSFAFYIVDGTHIKIVETDPKATAQLAGDLFSAPNTDGSFADSIVKGNYAFTLNGSNPTGTRPSAIGGVLLTSGTGSVTGGELDGSLGEDIMLTTASYAVDVSLGRILFTITIGSTTRYFAAYPTSTGTLLMIELDTDLQGAGTAYPQTGTAIPQGSFAFNLISSANTTGFTEEDVLGRVAVPSGVLVPLGDLNINDRGTLTSGVPIENTSTIVAPDMDGRGTTILDTHSVTYSLSYYVAGPTSAVVIVNDGSRVATGVIARQY
ncbi:MAG TPA: hypothetical protein VHX36_11755 [Candidatus Acidoferrales bacterium]|nr:hypothetical protein [Candidatus Acidoferrales bacterium]